jgi:hypothetical protein
MLYPLARAKKKEEEGTLQERHAELGVLIIYVRSPCKIPLT